MYLETNKIDVLLLNGFSTHVRQFFLFTNVMLSNLPIMRL